MYGVVLWSDHGQNRAVIWCEDHGDLAYYDGELPGASMEPGFDPGDLVRFDVSEGRRMRIASNPRVVASDQYPSLAGDLRREGARLTTTLSRDPALGQSKVIPLAPRRQAVQAAPKPKASNG
ncbi:hypothetical protein FDP25_15645 [Roseovarius sp. A21]|uniref:Cold shock protein, CspA family n=1 Tax=Roseovarius bejariae TaxID=2576383 RepID=A0A844CTW0_9RHOB|nr:hypothetical protein [Roseovarius bejariae]MRU16875.1 hypothetical protein [Roseovarius bejariae]